MKIFRTFSAARKELPRLLPLLRDSRVPMGAKIAAGLGAAFIISPLNILGDIPLLGFLDDAALLLFLTHWFVRYAESHLATANAQATPTMRQADVRATNAASNGDVRNAGDARMLPS